ncbi:hypothetical protein ACFQGE_16455 [Halomicroarcula sp. GCM10025817]|uniref:DUF7287 family protein n=1 Tax=Haloarcula TaxID=2237 RepID=UPI0023E8B12B|nr:hypothetical protein [Halomicroarcula sp. SYNS111]
MSASHIARGQVTLDFLTGMAVFFVVVGFVFMFVPGLVSSTQGDQETPMVADRVANQLVDFHLGEPASAALDPACTADFFGQDSPDACPTLETSQPLTDQLGIDDRYRVTVSIRADDAGRTDSAVLCMDGGVVAPCTGSAIPLAVGDAYQSGEGSVVTAERHVSLAGTKALLVVEVW